MALHDGHIIFKPNSKESFQREIVHAELEYRKMLGSINPLPEFDPGTGLYDVEENKPPPPLRPQEVLDLARSYGQHGVKVKIEYATETAVRVIFSRSNGWSTKTSTAMLGILPPVMTETTVRAILDTNAEGVAC